MKVVYEGPALAVVVDGGVRCERGKPVEVPSALGRRLIAQPRFRAVKQRRKRTAPTQKENAHGT